MLKLAIYMDYHNVRWDFSFLSDHATKVYLMLLLFCHLLVFFPYDTFNVYTAFCKLPLSAVCEWKYWIWSCRFLSLKNFLFLFFFSEFYSLKAFIYQYMFYFHVEICMQLTLFDSNFHLFRVLIWSSFFSLLWSQFIFYL